MCGARARAFDGVLVAAVVMMFFFVCRGASTLTRVLKDTVGPGRVGIRRKESLGGETTIFGLLLTSRRTMRYNSVHPMVGKDKVVRGVYEAQLECESLCVLLLLLRRILWTGNGTRSGENVDMGMKNLGEEQNEAPSRNYLVDGPPVV